MCPRCGYDLAWITEKWPIDGACALTQRCNECGYDFAWRDVFNERFRRLTWFAEHGCSVWSLVWRAWPTLLCILLPWIFWVKVGVHHRVNVRRMLAWPIVMAVVLVCAQCVLLVAIMGADLALTTGAVAGGFGLTTSQWMSEAGKQPIALLGEVAVLCFREPFGRDLHRIYPWGIVGLLGWTAGVVVTLGVLPTTRRLAKLRSVHLLRASVYGIAAPLLAVLVWLVGRAVYHLADALFAFTTSARSFGGQWPGWPMYAWSYAAFDDWDAVLHTAIGVWCLVWWGCAVAIGFRLRPAWLAVVIVSVVGVLSAMLAQALVTVVNYALFFGA